MTPSERTAAWRSLNPLVQDEEAQRKIIAGWIINPGSCPYLIHRVSYEIRSKATGRKQLQLLHKCVRLNRASVTWYLLHNAYAPRDALIFSARAKYIALKPSDLEG